MLRKPPTTNNLSINYSELKNAKFDDKQAKFILRKIKELETANDILELIKFHQVVLGQIKQKTDEKTHLEYKIVKQLMTNYDLAVRKNPQNYELHMDYFNFSTFTRVTDGMNKVTSLLTKNFQNVPEMWHHIAKWYERGNNDYTQARNFLRRGLILHKTNRLLYSAGIELEINKINTDNETKTIDQDIEESCNEIRTYIEAILENIKNFDFYLKILKLLEPHSYTIAEQQKIVEEFRKNYVNEPRMWEALAQRELNVLHNQSTADSRNSLPYRLKQCVTVFEEGLNQISNEKKPNLWRLYLNFLMELQRDLSVAGRTKTTALMDALDKASKEDILTESDFITWIKYVEDDNELAAILERSTQKLPQSVELWKVRLKHAMKKKRSNINAIFDQGVQRLKNDALPLWHMLIRYHTISTERHITKELYKRALQEPDEISSVLKPMYVRWLACSFSIHEARQAYNELANIEPHCRELHEQMIKLEEIQIHIDYEKCEKAFDNFCNQFGYDDADVWSAYDLFWLKAGKLDKSKNVVQKAMNTLNPMLLSVFRERHKLFMTELNKNFARVNN